MLKRRLSGSFEEADVKKVKRNAWRFEYGTACKIGGRKENQDAVLARLEPFTIFAVFDGHGNLGKLASSRAKSIAQTVVETYSVPETKESTEEIIREILQKIDDDLVQTGKVNDENFGTTATIAIPYGTDSVNGIVVGKVGDSDALVIKSENEFLPLDTSHRVQRNPSEQKRIKAEGGTIRRSYVIPGSNFSNEEIFKKKLGLALSRALGHFILRDYGVSQTPEIKDFATREGDILAIASDGIWDVLKIKSVAKKILRNKEKSLPSVCEDLCKDSLLSWREKLVDADNMGIVLVKF